MLQCCINIQIGRIEHYKNPNQFWQLFTNCLLKSTIWRFYKRSSTLSASMIFENSARQNLMVSSRDIPMPLRNNPYCIRPPWRRWWLLRSAECSCCMQSGKDCLDSCKINRVIMFLNLQMQQYKKLKILGFCVGHFYKENALFFSSS